MSELLRICSVHLIFLVIFSAFIYSQPQTEPNIPTIPAKAKTGLFRELVSVSYTSASSTLPTAFAFDDLYAYLATPDGLFRAALPLSASSTFIPIGFQNKNIFNIYVHNNSLYLLKDTVSAEGVPTDHGFLRSDDHGASFVPMDNGLVDCLGTSCSYLTSFHALFKDNLIFLNAGQGNNLQVSNDNGMTWIPLIGTIQKYIGCGDQSFGLVENRMLIGGTCLETGYIKSGLLRPNLTGWYRRPTDSLTPNLNPNGIGIIKPKPGTPDVYATTVGGLLKSSDYGKSFYPVIRYDLFGPVIPGISSFLSPSRSPNVIVVGGSLIAYSKDNGETWFDVSAKLEKLLGNSGGQAQGRAVRFMFEDPTGKIFIGVLDSSNRTIKIVQFRIDVATFR